MLPCSQVLHNITFGSIGVEDREELTPHHFAQLVPLAQCALDYALFQANSTGALLVGVTLGPGGLVQGDAGKPWVLSGGSGCDLAQVLGPSDAWGGQAVVIRPFSFQWAGVGCPLMRVAQPLCALSVSHPPQCYS